MAIQPKILRVTKTGLFVEDLMKTIKIQFIEAKRATSGLAIKTRKYMVNVIKSRKKPDPRSENRLENSILVHYEDDGNIVGVGKIAHMNMFAPYWNIVNYGGSPVHKPATQRHFVPGVFMGNKFIYQPGSSGGYMLPSGLAAHAVLPPMYYIERTKHWLRGVAKIHFSSVTQKAQIFMKTKQKIQIL